MDHRKRGQQTLAVLTAALRSCWHLAAQPAKGLAQALALEDALEALLDGAEAPHREGMQRPEGRGLAHEEARGRHAPKVGQQQLLGAAAGDVDAVLDKWHDHRPEERASVSLCGRGCPGRGSAGPLRAHSDKVARSAGGDVRPCERLGAHGEEGGALRDGGGGPRHHSVTHTEGFEDQTRCLQLPKLHSIVQCTQTTGIRHTGCPQGTRRSVGRGSLQASLDSCCVPQEACHVQWRQLRVLAGRPALPPAALESSPRRHGGARHAGPEERGVHRGGVGTMHQQRGMEYGVVAVDGDDQG
mmetsp:Transcript_27652/g.82508  ORF Transcript_27652/g.82508 Transcript_27652/m.82508 type:complete len:299 (-) Transcript_27652:791-1687(-)